MNTATRPLPPIFLSHGSPMTALEPREAGAFWQALGPALDQRFARPNAILAISAHTLTREPALLAAAQHDTVHDFSGFPPELYQLQWNAPGAPALAHKVLALLREAGINGQALPEGGLDHGIWAPLRFMYPDPTIPVLPLGFPPNWSPAKLFAMGQALAPLAAEGVLVMGTGSLTHNLRLVFAAGRPPIDAPEIDASAQFRRWWAERSAARDWDALFDYRRQAPHGVLMHPTDEHLLPWFVAAGAGGREAVPAHLHDSLTYGCLGMDAYAFGGEAAALAA
jgi:4,5-DOPA dioxygenase extradiol